MAWMSQASSSGKKPWESGTSNSRGNAWESGESNNGKNPWEGTVVTNFTPKWISTAQFNPKSPWLSQIEFSDFVNMNFPWLAEFVDHELVKEHTLLPLGTLQPASFGSAIAALCISIAAGVGGIALIIVTAGAATPGVVTGWGILGGTVGGTLLGVGVAGTVNAIGGISSGKFSWEKWGLDVAFAAGTSLVIFPTCVIGGQVIAGALITGAEVTARTAQAVAVGCGGLSGAGISEGSYILQCHVKNEPIQVLGLVLTGISGAYSGINASYLGATILPDVEVPDVSSSSLIGGLTNHLDGKDIEVNIFIGTTQVTDNEAKK